MKNTNLKLILFLISLIFSCSAFPFIEGKIYNFTVLHISDTHGEFMPNAHNHYGFSRLKYLVDSVRKEVNKKDGFLLVLSSGDMNTGNPRSDLQKGAPDIEAFNAIGLDALGVGNHEFDLVHDDLMTQKSLAHFPYLSANIYDSLTKKVRKFDPYLIKNEKGLKIAILGLTTEETNSQPKIEGFYFRPVLEEAKEHVDKLDKASDVLIGLTHIGFYKDGNYEPRTPGDVTLARSFKNKFDLILGGHTHTKLVPPQYEGKTIIAHSGDRGHYVSRLDFVFKDGKLSLKSYKLISLKDSPMDKNLQDLLDLYSAKGGKKISEKIGTTDSLLFGRTSGLKKETNLGRLITRAQNDLLKSDVAIMSDRGIRDNIDIGDITYESVLRVLPFHNTICTFDLTAKELKDYIESIPEILHFDGIKLYMKGKEIIEMEIRNKKVAFDEKDSLGNLKKYKVSLNVHNAAGGSLWPDQSKNPTFIDTGFDHSFVLKSYIQKLKVIKSSDFSEESVVRIAN